MTTPTNDEVKELGRVIDQMTHAQIEYIFKKANRRAQTLREEKALDNLEKLDIDDRVIIRDVKPKYLEGMTGVINGLTTDGKIKVYIDDRFNTRRYSHQLTLPANCVEKI